jgi:hypothetical protein
MSENIRTGYTMRWVRKSLGNGFVVSLLSALPNAIATYFSYSFALVFITLL